MKNKRENLNHEIQEDGVLKVVIETYHCKNCAGKGYWNFGMSIITCDWCGGYGVVDGNKYRVMEKVIRRIKNAEGS